jgi:hypothetical protein
LHHKYRTFIDGRSDFYAPEIRNDYLSILGSNWKAVSVLEKYDFQAALLPLEWTVTSLLKQSPDWQVLYDDGYAVYLEKINPEARSQQTAELDRQEGPGSSRDGVPNPGGILLGLLK